MDLITRDPCHLADLCEEPLVPSQAWVFAWDLWGLGCVAPWWPLTDLGWGLPRVTLTPLLKT